MTGSTAHTQAIVLVFTRPSDFGQEAEWNAWYDEVHLPATVRDSGARVATRWEVIDRPPGFSTPVGFTHVAIYEFDDAEVGPNALLELVDGPRGADSPIHRLHTIIDVDVLALAGGRWTEKAPPSDELTGQVIAYVAPNDPARLDEWNEWLDQMHVPDMMASGAFANTTRWLRTAPRRFGPNHLTIYDVAGPTVAEAVALSGAAMGPAHADGRLREFHSGGLRAALQPAGSHGASGFRKDG